MMCHLSAMLVQTKWECSCWQLAERKHLQVESYGPRAGYVNTELDFNINYTIKVFLNKCEQIFQNRLYLYKTYK